MKQMRIEDAKTAIKYGDLLGLKKSRKGAKAAIGAAIIRLLQIQGNGVNFVNYVSQTGQPVNFLQPQT
jgi:hypothetical protein